MPSRVQYLCDLCYEVDTLADGQSFTVGIGNIQRSMILCSDHEDDLLKPLVTALLEHGARLPAGTPLPAAPTSRRGMPAQALPDPTMTVEQAQQRLNDGLCIVPGCEESFRGRERVGPHLRTAHGLSITALGLGVQGVMGHHPKSGTGAVRDRDNDRRVQPQVCTECEPPRHFAGLAGFRSHQRAFHH